MKQDADVMAALSDAAYTDTKDSSGEVLPPGEWGRDHEIVDKSIGFYAVVFKNNDNPPKRVLAFRGTETNKGFWEGNKDVSTDVKNAASVSTEQYRMAAMAAKDLKKNYPDSPIFLTGHSLGGGLAEYAGALTGLETVT
ncbi:MAG: DUF2974 domain-containing protein, partial [Candidatus Sumerlaeota bacterium]|nr:DUF2974 domain-containing protein [Candidatus Sumerlaeota bacterium]